MRLDKKYFFDTMRDSKLFGGELTPTQVTAMNGIIDSYAGESFDHLSYTLATPYHEVGRDLEPVSENLNYSAKRLREVWPSRFKSDATAKQFANNPEALANKVYGGRNGNDQPGDGWLYRGRGYPQITGKENYAKLGKAIGVDLVGNPDLALTPAIAARITAVGMERGLFTGKKLADYDRTSGYDFVGARAIINADGKTNGGKIADYAKEFRKAMREPVAGAEVIPGKGDKSTVIVPPKADKPNTPNRNGVLAILAMLGGVIVAILKGLGVIG